jgi:diguanylate cyclase (GGDEF)-like protein/PAS domain S-box-containing protein
MNPGKTIGRIPFPPGARSERRDQVRPGLGMAEGIVGHRRWTAAGVVAVIGLPIAAMTGVLSPLPALWLRLALVIAGVASVMIGIRRHRPGRVRPWLLLLAGLVCSLAGDAIVIGTFLQGSLTATVSVDAWLTALAGLLFLSGVLDATAHTRRADTGGLLDAVVVALAVGTVVWSALVVPSAAPGWVGGSVETAGSLQILVFAALIALMLRTYRLLPSGRRLAAGVATAALACATMAFVLGALTDAGGAVPYTGARASFGAAANLLMGTAALHPSMRWLTERVTVGPDPLTGTRTMWLGGALVAPPAILLWSLSTQRPVSIVILAGAWILLVPSVLARLYLLGRDQAAAERRTDATERRLAALVAHTGDVLLLVRTCDETPIIEYASPAAQVLLGREPEGLVGTPLRDLVTPSTRGMLDEVLTAARLRLSTADVRAVAADGRPRWVQVVGDRYLGDDEHDALVVTLRDVTQRKVEEQRWVEAALRDPGTGLANRRAIEDHLRATLSRDDPTSSPLAVLMCDLDDFKAINDAHGHAVGDAVLREVAARLRAAVRRSDVVGRLGGDEFVVLCSLDDGRAALDQVAARVVTDLGAPFVVQGHEVRLGCSVGAALSGAEGAEGPELLHAADLALLRAKAAGKGRVVWSDDREPTDAF